ncbi:MAG: hypothetical protein ACUVV4_08860 [Candidatus Bathyarchaeia archaeon]
MHEYDRILTNPSRFKNIHLKAMKTLNAIKPSYEIISDIEMEQIEAEKIKRLLEEPHTPLKPLTQHRIWAGLHLNHV